MFLIKCTVVQNISSIIRYLDRHTFDVYWYMESRKSVVFSIMTCKVFMRYNWTIWCYLNTNTLIFSFWKHCASITSKLLSVIEHKNNNGNYNNWVLVVHYLVCKDALVPLVKRFVWLSGSIRAVRHASRNRIRYLTYMHLF